MPCCKCEREKDEIFCVDCKESFCRACAVRSHHPNTNDDTHSLEEIKDDEGGVHMFSTLSDEILILAIVWFICHLPYEIPHDYVIAPTICPGFKHFQYFLANSDAGLFYIFKGMLLQYCSVEDSLWRFFGDFWVRGIVTNTDTVFLLISTSIMLVFSEIALLLFAIPVIAFIYAFIFSVIYKIESFIPRWPFLLELERYSSYLNVTEFFDVPPDTKPRKRNAMDFVDWIKYMVRRAFRRPLHFFSSTTEVLQSMCTKATGFLLVARLGCTLMGLGPALRKILSIFGYRQLLQKHQAWFGTYVTRNEYSDSLLWQAFGKIAGIGIGQGVPSFLVKWLGLFMILPGFGLWWFRRKQREEFMRTWEATERRRVLGTCSIDECACCSVQFCQKQAHGEKLKSN